MTYDELKIQFLKTLPFHVSSNGMICQLNQDLGDGAQRLGTLTTLLSLLNDSALNGQISTICPTLLLNEKAYDSLDTDFNWYTRSSNPSSPAWQRDDRQTSRDQLSILRLGMATSGMKVRLLGNLFAQICRLIFHQNYWNGTNYQIPDIMSPDEIGTFARGLLWWFSEIVTNFTDLTYAVNMAIRSYSGPQWGSDNQLAQELLVSANFYPSIVGKICMWFYKKTNFMSQIWAYHTDTAPNNGCEALYWLFRMAYLKLEGYDPGTTAP